MSAVWKYPVVVDDTFTLKMPLGSRVLTVQTQNGEPVVWALVEEDAPTEPRTFHLLGTGHDASRVLPLDEYIGTFQLPELGLAFHLFEKKG